MLDYIKLIIIVLISGALVMMFLTMGLVVFAALAITMPILFFWHRYRLKKKLEQIYGMHQNTGENGEIIDADYEIIDEEEHKK